MPEHTPESFAAELTLALKHIDPSGRAISLKERVGRTVRHLTHDLPSDPEEMKNTLAQIVDAAVIHGEV